MPGRGEVGAQACYEGICDGCFAALRVECHTFDDVSLGAGTSHEVVVGIVDTVISVELVGFEAVSFEHLPERAAVSGIVQKDGAYVVFVVHLP